jgi:hypothetical protein
MKQHAKRHFIYHISLVSILVLGLLAFLLSPSRKLEVVLITFASYVIWGIVHHHINHDLMPKIVIEYILIGLLGTSIILFMLRGGIGI